MSIAWDDDLYKLVRYQPQSWIYTRVHWMHGDVPGSQFVSTINSESLEQAKEITYDGVPAYFLKVFPSVLKNFIGCSGANMVGLYGFCWMTQNTWLDPWRLCFSLPFPVSGLHITREWSLLSAFWSDGYYIRARRAIICTHAGGVHVASGELHFAPFAIEYLWWTCAKGGNVKLLEAFVVKCALVHSLSDSTPSNKYVTTIVIEHFCLVCTEFSVIK